MHDIYRSWRAVADEYPGRVLIGEVWLPDAARLARYVTPGELHTVFNFPYLSCPWDAAALRRVIDETLALNAPAGAPATWVLSNHDVDRIVSRYGRADTAFDLLRRRYFHDFPVDLALGTRRARAAALLTMALPGSVYIYQGEELGLWEVQDIPDELRQDPIWRRTHGADPGRDGSRVPLPWSGTEPPFGFSPPGAVREPWLPQPKEWRDLTVEAESASDDSMLRLYRDALRIRRASAALGDGPMTWLPAADGGARLRPGARCAWCVCWRSALRRQPVGRPGRAAAARRGAAHERAAYRRPAPPGHHRLARRVAHAAGAEHAFTMPRPDLAGRAPGRSPQRGLRRGLRW